ncbi:hypothetical protein [Endozoicomonas sp. 8E]|uniref:hypothetical protein n=1 Tax=Endozoicomonas sp. 8E TaxID=3035692 RepID=UPI002939501C|nr:hypothetical protein [Endozoicomonas sp. 8E]WOG25990.1 hypothetical protein P6910_15580 [Endozoicomonas sp. 8E]
MKKFHVDCNGVLHFFHGVVYESVLMFSLDEAKRQTDIGAAKAEAFGHRLLFPDCHDRTQVIKSIR